MKTSPRNNIASLGATFFALWCLASPAFAGSATWLAMPSSGDWNTAANWGPPTVPNAAVDVATFGMSATTTVSLSASTVVNGIVFDAGASGFTIRATSLTISGVGITNNAGITQNFVEGVPGDNFGIITFTNSATAGSNTAFTADGAAVSGTRRGFTRFFNSSTAGNGTFTTNGGAVSGALGGFTQFSNSSTAGNGTFTTNGGAVSGAGRGDTNFFSSSTAGNGTFTNNGGAVSGAEGGRTAFSNTSIAGSATFTNNGSTVSGGNAGFTQFGGGSSASNGTFSNNGGAVSGAIGGATDFFGTSSAGNGTFTNNGGAVSGAQGGRTFLTDTATAGNATLIANGGTGGGDGGSVLFTANSSGGTARVEVFGNGNLDISPHNAPGVTLGSIEGNGAVFLGANNLTVGSNDLSTTFSGVIQDGGSNPGTTGGSLSKIGLGTLVLSGANTYTGGTTIDNGSLSLQGSSAILGSGNVTLASGAITLEITTGVLDALNDAATLSLAGGGTANFADAGYATLEDGINEIVGTLILNGVSQAPGTYGSSTSSADFQFDEFFSGNGLIEVVPEPSTWAMTMVGTGFLFGVQRLRRKRN